MQGWHSSAFGNPLLKEPTDPVELCLPVLPVRSERVHQLGGVTRTLAQTA